MKSSGTKRWFAAILVLMMVLALLPAAAFAEGEGDTQYYCGLEESDGHQHGEACYTTSKTLACTEDEHTHDASCYCEGTLTCEKTEHMHGNDCYTAEKKLTCTLEESEGHTHTPDCLVNPDETKCTCKTKCTADEKTTSCPVCGAENADIALVCIGQEAEKEKQEKTILKKSAPRKAVGAEQTYTVNVTIGVALTDATVIITDGTNKYTGYAASVAAFGFIPVTGVPAGTYTATVTGKNDAGESCKGSDTLYNFYFDNTEDTADGAIDDFGIYTIVKDTNDKVELSFSLQNPIAAIDGQKYPFENITGSLIGADGTAYPLSLNSNGYYSATVPANQPYTLSASGWRYEYIDNGTRDESVKYSFDGFMGNIKGANTAQARTFTMTMPEAKVTKTVDEASFLPLTVTVTDESTGEGISGASVEVQTPYNEKLTGVTTDADGKAEYKVHKITGGTNAKFSVTATAQDGRSETAELVASGAKECSIVLGEPLKVIEIVTVGGKEVGREESSASVKSFDAASLRKNVNATKGKAKVVGIDISDETGSSAAAFTVSLGADGDYKITAVDSGKLNGGDTVVIKYNYEYTDADAEYNLTVKHVFAGAEKQSEEKKLKAGEEVSEKRMSEYGELWISQDTAKIDGYTRGAWIVDFVEITGGGNVLGEEFVNQSDIDVKGAMLHENLDIVFNYRYIDNYIEYNANASDATGEMYIDWAYAGQEKTIKNINNDTETVKNSYAREDYYFTGWNTKPDGSGNVFKPGQTVAVPSDNLVLYAQWEPYYTITFKDYDGVIISTKSDYKFGDNVVVPEDPTRAADENYTYAFSGWDKAVSKTVQGNAVYVATYKATARTINVTLNKVWVDNSNNAARTTSITVRFAGSDGKTYDVTVFASQSWTATAALPRLDANGKEITYSVKEVTRVSGYNSGVNVTTDKDTGNMTVTVTNSRYIVPFYGIKTGDDANLALWATLAGISLLGIASAVIVIRRKRKNGAK